MFALFRALTERVKALFITTVALDFEAELLTRDAERKAELLRQAARYEDEGFSSIAQQLRNQAEALSLQRPLDSVLPAIEYLQAEAPATPTVPQLFAPDTDTPATNPTPARFSRSPTSRKKGR